MRKRSRPSSTHDARSTCSSPRNDVDRTRVGYYGFSYGAWLGAIAAAVDKRISLVVLRSGGPQILAEIARASARTLTPKYTELMARVDQMA